jgi:hypothetical protein
MVGEYVGLKCYNGLFHGNFHFFLWGGTKSLGTAVTSGLLYKPQMIDGGDCGAIGGMKIGRENRRTRRKPAPAPLCSPQIPHDQTRARTRAAAVGSQRLTAWAMARPISIIRLARIMGKNTIHRHTDKISARMTVTWTRFEPTTLEHNSKELYLLAYCGV